MAAPTLPTVAGNFRAVVANLTAQQASLPANGARYTMTLVLLDSEVRGALFRTTIGSSPKEWLDVVESLTELEGRMVVVRLDLDETNTLVFRKLSPTDIPRTIERFGRTYSLVEA